VDVGGGASVGALLGMYEGQNVGLVEVVGGAEGVSDGAIDGESEGLKVGWCEGFGYGATVGLEVGNSEGLAVKGHTALSMAFS